MAKWIMLTSASAGGHDGKMRHEADLMHDTTLIPSVTIAVPITSKKADSSPKSTWGTVKPVTTSAMLWLESFSRFELSVSSPAFSSRPNLPEESKWGLQNVSVSGEEDALREVLEGKRNEAVVSNSYTNTLNLTAVLGVMFVVLSIAEVDKNTKISVLAAIRKDRGRWVLAKRSNVVPLAYYESERLGKCVTEQGVDPSSIGRLLRKKFWIFCP
jgi:hypothetical protein